MIRRLPTLPLAFAAALGLFLSLGQAQPPAAAPATPEVKPDDIKRNQEENAKLFKRFSEELLRLAQRWEKSDNLDERERAKSLRGALQLVEKHGVETLFKELVGGLAGAPNGGVFGDLIKKDERLRAALVELLAALETDEADNIKAEIARIKDLIKEIERIKREQENLRARTENPKGNPDKIARDQKDLANQTKQAADKFDPKGKDGKAGGAGAKEDPKAEAKPEGKPGDAAPEAKPDTQENKSDSKADGMGGMGQPKDGAGGEPKPSPAGGMPNDGDKPAPKDGAGAGDPKAGGEPKPMGGDPTKPPMAGDQPKPSPADSKAQGDGKGDGKPSDGMPGGEGKPMSGMGGGMPMAGGPPSQSKPGGGQPGQGGAPPPGGPQQPKDNAQEQVEKAVPDQQEAEDQIKKNNAEQASAKQGDAIKKLEEALKELEKRLKQLREKELKQLLANLEERVGRMLRMQIEVYEATKRIDEVVKKNGGKKSDADLQKAGAEAEKEQAIVAEADKALKLMEGEGSAVVFAGVLSQVKGDMEAVQRRLNEGRVEKQTQLIEEDIIEQLKMMKEALKKAKQDLDNPKDPPPPGQGEGKPQDKKLIDLINELKLIKSLQEQVNKRTIGYNEQDPGEQAKDALVQAELKQLSERQRVLQEMLHKIATQANQ
ncbi:MAG: hypothetical protein C0501_29165 [Isosphaera sp.]|nr:hypothetical protein [Isosphaera sp.]